MNKKKDTTFTTTSITLVIGSKKKPQSTEKLPTLNQENILKKHVEPPRTIS